MPSIDLVPRRLQPGDTVAVVCPSAPAVALWPHRTERGTAYLESLGLRVRLMPNTSARDRWVAGSPQARAADLHAAFADDEVAAVLCAIGGNHSLQVVPHLDFDLIAANPKIFQGYSDITVLHWALAKQTGLRTFYGPALSADLAEYPEVFDFTDRFLRAAWFGDTPLEFGPASEWTEEFLDWNKKLDLTRPRRMRPGGGWVTVREGVAQGPLLGGCVETICWHLKGSPWWPDLDGAVFFLETSEEAPSPAHVDAYLTGLEQLGAFDALAGLVFARPAGYGDADVDLLWQIVAERTAAADIPVLANVDAGHTEPMLTLPLGAPVHLDAGQRTFRTLEPVTRPTLESSPIR